MSAKAKKEITLFFHCRGCMPARPENISPGEWQRIEVGYVHYRGIVQVWCLRCDREIASVILDLESARYFNRQKCGCGDPTHIASSSPTAAGGNGGAQLK